MTISHTITRERTVATGPLGIATIDTEEEIDIEVEIKYWKESKGHRDKYGCPEEPDTPAELEITKVTPDIELEESEIDAIEQKAWEKIADEAHSYQEDGRIGME